MSPAKLSAVAGLPDVRRRGLGRALIVAAVAGQGFACFAGSTPIRLINEGRDNRHAFPMFVIDPTEPQTSPAEFSASLPDAGQAAPAQVQRILLRTNPFDWPLLLPVLAVGVGAVVLMAGLILRRSRRSR